MAHDYRRHGKSSPFCYGSTEGAGLPQSQGSSDSFQGSTNTSYPRLGEQHPEGAQAKAAPDYPVGTASNLNFGWFSMPGTREGVPGGMATSDVPPTDNQMPPSRNGSRPPSQQMGDNQQPPSRMGSRPGSNPPPRGSYPPSRAGSRTDNQCQGHYPPQAMETVPGEEPGYQQAPNYQPSAPRDSNIVIDWPISQIAQEQITRFQPPPEQIQQPDQASVQSSRGEAWPSAEGNQNLSWPPSNSGNQVPPTPVPPLYWEGYRNTARPTFASWHEEWHRSQGRPPPYDANYNNSGVFNSNNSNSNTETEDETCRDCDRSSSIGQGQVTVRADGNNNNLTEVSGGSTQLRPRLTTLPPYGQTSPAPEFYSPNVVMKWEETDEKDRTASQKDNQGDRAFVKWIRSSILSLATLFSCLDASKRHPAGHKVKLFKYNRFDSCDKPQ